MSFWDRLSKYRTHGPQAVGELALQPADVFRRILGQIADEELLPLGWSRGTGLQWFQPIQPWADEVIAFTTLRSAAGIRWGLRLSFVPKLKKSRHGADLHLSHDPLDYEKDAASWMVSQFANEEELRSDTRAMVRKAIAESRSLVACCRDLHSLVKCFEDKKARKYRRFGFHHYPHEVLADAAVLGLVGREEDGLQELDAAFDRLKASPAERERFRQALTELWKKGI